MMDVFEKKPFQFWREIWIQIIVTLCVTFNNATFNWIVQNMFFFYYQKTTKRLSIIQNEWNVHCARLRNTVGTLVCVAVRCRAIRRCALQQVWSPTYLHNGHSQTMLANFCPSLTTYPLLKFVGNSLTVVFEKSVVHIIDTSSTTYLTGLVNVVCERPHICNYNWLSALRPLQIQKHPLWSESCSSIKYKKNHRDLGKLVAFVERSPLRPVQWYDLFSHTRWTILTFDNHCTSSHSGLFGQDRTCSVFGPAAFWRVFQFSVQFGCVRYVACGLVCATCLAEPQLWQRDSQWYT